MQKRRPDNKSINIPLDVVQNPSSRQNRNANGRRRATIPKRATRATAATGNSQNRVLKVIMRVHGFGAYTFTQTQRNITNTVDFNQYYFL